MKAPNWQDLVLDGGILPEPSGEPDRLILWRPGERDADYHYWERISVVPQAEVTAEGDVLAVPVAIIPTRLDLRGFLARMLSGGSARDSRVFELPTGQKVSQCGPRRSNALLVWCESPRGTLDHEAVTRRCPDARDVRKLGNNLFLVEGLPARSSAAAAAETAVMAEPVVPVDSPRELARRILADAQARGDRTREASALTDLGVISLNEGDAKAAASFLEPALALVRELGDRDREHDVLGNLGMAAIGLRDPRAAWGLFQQQLAYARANGDRFSEKIALERLGVASWSLGDPRRAIEFYNQALALTRAVGDRYQESNLLWQMAIQHAELGERALAIRWGEESIEVLKKLGRPQAAWYGSLLQKYRVGASASVALDGPGAGSADPRTYLGVSTVSTAMATGAPAPTQNPGAVEGPGLLRMAMSATKAMANFVGSGFKTLDPRSQAARQRICATCEHHTGLRCKICGCFTNVKSRMLHEDCPIGKWPQVS